VTEITYKCCHHGLQPVNKLILPGNIYILNCGCIYKASYHGSNYRIKTSYCDKCGFIIKDICLISADYTTKFYHIECAKGLEIKDGKIMNIDEYPNYEVEGLNK